MTLGLAENLSHSRFQQTVASLVLLAFLALNVAPAAAAVRDEAQRQRAERPVTPQDRHGELIEALDRRLHDVIRKGTQKQPDLKPEREALKALRAALKAEDDATLDGFARDLEHIEEHRLAPVIRQRHSEVVKRFKEEAKAVQDLLTQMENAEAQALTDLAERLKAQLEKDRPKRPRAIDPDNLPFRTGDPKVREPETDPEVLKQLLAGRSLEAPVLDVAERKQDVPAPYLAKIEHAVREGSPYPMEPGPLELASLGAPISLVGTLPTPGPEFLTPTEDVQITPAIQAKAAELDHNPVKIYHWVRNHIEFIPSYGSIQGSQLTLDKKAGNAFDTASLLIALLRAAGIPARYAYGTVEIPIDQAMNWVGGATHADAAQQLLSQGGIPNVALTSAGVTKAVRMEHVWVEAFVDYYPSRGARNLVPDSWVPMDASFKQYQYSEGMDLRQQAPFNAEAFVTAAQEGATVSESEGWVQNLNHANIQNQLNQYQQQLQASIEQQNQNATVGDVLGARTIVPHDSPYLAATLPLKLVTVGTRFAQLPDPLQHKFRYSVYLDVYQRAMESPLFVYEIETVKLAGKKLTLTFVPSSDADRQAIESYLPKPHADGSPIQPSEFPQSLPAYSIRVTPELRVDGEKVAGSGTYTLGTELVGEGGFTQMNLRAWDLTPDTLVAGQTGALGISLQGIAAAQLDTLKTRLENTKAKLEAQAFEGLTGEHLSGDLLTAVVWSYFASLESFGRIAQKQANMVDTPGLSYGFFYAQAVPITGYAGIVKAVSFPGVLMDIGHARRLAYAKNNSQQEWIQYNRLRGQHASAMEHAIPERFFDDPTDDVTPQGVSAVKAIAIAAQQGQKIYTLTQANQSQLVNIQQRAEVMDEIRAALAAGKEVTVHQGPISYAGFFGAGYVVTDPDTGAGGYLIEGGSRGGVAYALGLHSALLIYLAVLAVGSMSLSGPFAVPAALTLLVMVVIPVLIAYATAIKAFIGDDKAALKCYIGGILQGITVLATLALGKLIPGINKTADLLISAISAALNFGPVDTDGWTCMQGGT